MHAYHVYLQCGAEVRFDSETEVSFNTWGAPHYYAHAHSGSGYSYEVLVPGCGQAYCSARFEAWEDQDDLAPWRQALTAAGFRVDS